MAHQVVEIKTKDNVLIPCGIWDAGGDAILYLHGIESHMGWFKDMAEKLQESGFSVYAIDRRGSGLSKEERGHIDSYRIILDDIERVVEEMRSKRPGKKIFLMGICGGGKFAANFVSSHPNSVDGLILISPAIKAKVTLSPMKKLDVLFSSFFNPKKMIPTPLSYDMFTKNKKYIEFIKNDSLSLHSLTARFYRELAIMDAAVSRKIFNTKIPVLTVLAEDDPIVNNDAMVKWHSRLKTGDKTIKLFNGCCHFLPFQDNLDDIVKFVAAWMKGKRGA
ncbi:MAG: alpha/beta fold hydrolase [Candidatus Omnitrophica bacterium]|nr:alpha/beta fold hydrolase [Candidatus Omnitrophota bacterium]